MNPILPPPQKKKIIPAVASLQGEYSKIIFAAFRALATL